ncbi:MAG: class IV adenylate cyclase [Thermococci archaeon]|nr:class IV adenylate cyclase [Thermococci archaeon]
MIEVEVKGYADDGVFSTVRRRFDPIRTERHEDTYFGHPCRDFASTDEALRIRIKRFDGHFEAFLTYKGPKLDDRSKTREEIEVAVEDPDGYSKILERLGFSEVAKIVKTREVYFVEKGVTLALDDVEGLGKFVEAEALTEDTSKVGETVDMLVGLLRSIGVERLERRSYLELLFDRNRGSNRNQG